MTSTLLLLDGNVFVLALKELTEHMKAQLINDQDHQSQAEFQDDKPPLSLLLDPSSSLLPKSAGPLSFTSTCQLHNVSRLTKHMIHRVSPFLLHYQKPYPGRRALYCSISQLVPLILCLTNSNNTHLNLAEMPHINIYVSIC